MSRKICLFAVVLLAAVVSVVPIATAQTVHYVGVGSSAMFNGFAYSAYNDLILQKGLTKPTTSGGHCPVGDTCVAKHWSNSAKSAYCKDTRTNTASVSPGNQAGTLWIDWVEDTTASPNVALDVWAYLNIDSAVGDRCFLARNGSPAVSDLLIVGVSAGQAGNNVPDSTGLLYADGVSGSLDSPITQAVLTLLNQPAGIPFTAAMTDIRPEDALLATQRILGSGNASLTNGCSVADPDDTNATPLDPYGSPCWFIYSFALGYGNPAYDPGTSAATAAIGQNIVDGTPAGGTTQPVLFALPGLTDPMSGDAVPNTIKTFPVGEVPIVFVVNRTNTSTGLGQVIGSYVAGNGNCYGGGLSGCQPQNTGQPAGYSSDGSYYVRNLWDQHPWPKVNNVYPALQNTVVAGDPSGNGFCFPGGVYDNTDSMCHVTRRPLGNLYASGDCEGDNSAFTWPLAPGNTQGLRAQIPNRIAFPITIFEREPLSGTYNTTEFNVIRAYGTPGGSMGSSDPSNPVPGAGENPYAAGITFERPAYVSQETYVHNAAGTNPVATQCQADFGEVNPGNEGYRYRAIGTGHVIPATGKATLNGVSNTNDSMGYAFYSAGNVLPISLNVKYGYLMIDAVDPLFDNYENAVYGGGAPAPVTTANGDYPAPWGGGGGFFNVEGEPACEGGHPAVAGSCLFSLAQPHEQEPGQPASNAALTGIITGYTTALLSWGVLPSCGSTGATALPICTAAHIWHTPVAADASANCPAGSPCTFPHLRDGSYAAWSELRMVCDTASTNCSTSSDSLGAEALVQALQQDIHNNATAPSGAGYGVPDFLPFDDAQLAAWNGGSPYGDAYYLRDHYGYAAADDSNMHGTQGEFPTCANTTTHESNVVVNFGNEVGCTAGVPVNGPPNSECGGDAGGYVRAAVAANYTPFYSTTGASATGCVNTFTSAPVTGVPGDLQ